MGSEMCIRDSCITHNIFKNQKTFYLVSYESQLINTDISFFETAIVFKKKERAR